LATPQNEVKCEMHFLKSAGILKQKPLYNP